MYILVDFFTELITTILTVFQNSLSCRVTLGKLQQKSQVHNF